jgi:uncharacterized membrane protein
MEENIYIDQNYNLTRLRKFLNYQVSSSLLYFLSFQVFVFIFIASAAALIFTPFMLYVLVTEKKYGWIVFFIIIVVVPIIVLLILSWMVEFSRPLLFITLGLFYFYCFLLRFQVNDWSREAMARNQYLFEKKQREDDLKLFEDKF